MAFGSSSFFCFPQTPNTKENEMKRMFWSLASLAGLIGCGSSLDQLARLSKQEQAYLACSQLGFTSQNNQQFFDLFQSWKASGLTFDQSNSFVISVARDACGADVTCTTLVRGCLELMVEAVYFPDGRGISTTPAGFLELKMPLPGGKYWLLTTEIGGGDCATATPDGHHTGINHYSLDFDDTSLVNGVVKQEYGVPVYAAASGTVLESPLILANGNYVVIDHGNGYTTRYLHLRDAPVVLPGQKITTGTQIGVVGNSGDSTGSHLHFGVRYHNDGSAGVAELQKVTLEGRSLSAIKTNCDASGSRIAYYQSTNTP